MRSAGENGASDLDLREKSERHFRSVCIALLSHVFDGDVEHTNWIAFMVSYINIAMLDHVTSTVLNNVEQRFVG